MSQRDRVPFGHEDQEMHRQNEPFSRQLPVLDPESRAIERRRLQLSALEVVGKRPPFINYTRVDTAAEIVLYDARFRYLAGAAATASFPEVGWNDEMRAQLRNRLREMVGDHVEVTVSSADDLLHSTGAEPTGFLINVIITPRS